MLALMKIKIMTLKLGFLLLSSNEENDVKAWFFDVVIIASHLWEDCLGSDL